MRWLIIFAVCLAASACSAPQPESGKAVAAFEVPLASQSERDRFLDLLRQQAGAEGLHVDAATNQELHDTAEVGSNDATRIHAGIWRGQKDDDLEGSVMNVDHPDLVWIMFLKGRHPDVATRFRQRVMAAITQLWPETRSLPIMPNGTIPLRHALVLTRDGYRVKPEAASDEGLSPGSPLIAAR